MTDIIDEISVKSLLIVSHNPGISDMISQLSRSQAYNFPTCVFAGFTIDKIKEEKKISTEFIIRPKDGNIISLN